MHAHIAQTAAHPVHFIRRIANVAAAPAAVSNLTTHCSSCHLRDLCLPCGLAVNDLHGLDEMGFGRRRLKMGEALYHEGDHFHFIYAVRTGTFKSSLILADGREQVSAFHMAGELMGLDGVAAARHGSTSTALEDAEVCTIPYSLLNQMSVASGNLQNIVNRLMSREIVRDHSLMLLLGSMSAEERLAAFLLNLSQRLKARGYSQVEFHLRMSRQEIGSYLGMKIETVSRTFTTFQQRGILEVDKRHIRITDPDALTRVFETRMH